MPNGPCLEHRPQLVCQGPQQQTLESLSSPLPLNFNFVVTECPCVPKTKYVSGSAVPESWPTWSSEGQGTRVVGPALEVSSPLPHLGQGVPGSPAVVQLLPLSYKRKRKTTSLHLPGPLWDVCWPGRGQSTCAWGWLPRVPNSAGGCGTEPLPLASARPAPTSLPVPTVTHP